MNQIETTISLAATNIAKAVEANCIVSIEKKTSERDFDEADSASLTANIKIFKRIKDNVYTKNEYPTKLKKRTDGSIIPIKEALMEAINKQFINKGDRVVCVSDESIGFGYQSLIFIFDVDKIFFNMGTHNLAENIDTTVLESVINIALELNREGREGKQVGTAFIIGDKSEILKHTKQLVVNPFAGMEESQRRITDPAMRETVKAFSTIDGAFVVDKDGTIVTAGAYITTPPQNINLRGFGTRHTACAAITQEVPSCIAVVVSQSGGIIRVMKGGNIVMKLP